MDECPWLGCKAELIQLGVLYIKRGRNEYPLFMQRLHTSANAGEITCAQIDELTLAISHKITTGQEVGALTPIQQSNLAIAWEAARFFNKPKLAIVFDVTGGLEQFVASAVKRQGASASASTA